MGKVTSDVLDKTESELRQVESSWVDMSLLRRAKNKDAELPAPGW